MSPDSIRTLRGLLCTGLGAAALALPVSAASQPIQDTAPSQTAAELPKARTIIDRYLETTGSNKLFETKSSRKTTGSVEIIGMGIEGTYEILQTKPASLLLNMEMPAMGAFKQGFDGEVGWSDNPMMGPMLIEGTQLGQLKLQAAFDSSRPRPEELRGHRDHRSLRLRGQELLPHPLRG